MISNHCRWPTPAASRLRCQVTGRTHRQPILGLLDFPTARVLAGLEPGRSQHGASVCSTTLGLAHGTSDGMLSAYSLNRQAGLRGNAVGFGRDSLDWTVDYYYGMFVVILQEFKNLCPCHEPRRGRARNPSIVGSRPRTTSAVGTRLVEQKATNCNPPLAFQDPS